MIDISGPSDALGSTPLAVEGPARDGPWFLRGSRLRAEGNDLRGLRMVTSGDTGLIHSCSNSAAPARSIRIDPGLVTRSWSDGGVERTWTALTLPVLVWEYDGPASGVLDWQTPAFAGGSVAWEGGSSCAVTLESGERILFMADGGSLSSSTKDGSAGFRFEYSNHARLVAIAAADVADERRTADHLLRRGIAGLASERSQHAAHLGKLGTRLHSPDKSIDRAFSWAAILCEEAATSGALDSPVGASLARALRAAGLQRAVRTVATVVPASGPVTAEEAFHRLRDAGSQVNERNAEMFGPDPARAAGVLIDGVNGLFGISSDKACDGFTLRPALPDEWTTMGLERLRVGSAVLDVDVRRRPSSTLVSVRIRSGGPLMVAAGVADTEVAQVELDDVVMPSEHARFEARQDHTLVFRHAD